MQAASFWNYIIEGLQDCVFTWKPLQAQSHFASELCSKRRTEERPIEPLGVFGDLRPCSGTSKSLSYIILHVWETPKKTV